MNSTGHSRYVHRYFTNIPICHSYIPYQILRQHILYNLYIYIYICHILYTLIYIYIYYLLTDRSLALSLVESNRIGRRVDCLLIASYLALALVLNCPDHPEPSRAQSNSHILPADIHTDKIIHTHMYICKYTHIYSIQHIQNLYLYSTCRIRNCASCYRAIAQPFIKLFT